MTELSFERTFRSWCISAGVGWRTFRYPRPVAGGETEAHSLSPPRASRGSVLVVHGAGNDALFSLTQLFAALLERDFEIFTFDVDGHGRHSTTLLSPESAADCVPAALSAWEERNAELPLHAVGISLGGALLLESLPGLSSRLTSATLVSAPLRVELSWRTIRREIGTPMLRTIWRGRSRFGLTGLIPSFGPFRRDLYPLRLSGGPRPGPFGYVDVINSILEELDLPEAAQSAALPVLLIYGGRDLLVPVAQAQRLTRLLAASELLLLPRDTHLSTPLAPAAQDRLLSWVVGHSTGNHSAA